MYHTACPAPTSLLSSGEMEDSVSSPMLGADSPASFAGFGANKLWTPTWLMAHAELVVCRYHYQQNPICAHLALQLAKSMKLCVCVCACGGTSTWLISSSQHSYVELQAMLGVSRTTPPLSLLTLNYLSFVNLKFMVFKKMQEPQYSSHIGGKHERWVMGQHDFKGYIG